MEENKSIKQVSANANSNQRSWKFDILKAIAIIAVFFYHVGLLNNGYLGVDVFFVISGFFLMKSYLKARQNGEFKYFNYVLNRIKRFAPLILIVSFICLILGFITMLPDDFENLGESVVASNIFANNILSSITTKNYWNISNNYKPLMHLWYIGVLMQAFVVFPLVFQLAARRSNKVLFITVVILALISFVLYLFPNIPESDKFYWLPFRAFEILLGCIVCLLEKDFLSKKVGNVLEIIISLLIVFILFFRFSFVSKQLYLILTVILTAGLVFLFNAKEEKNVKAVTPIVYIGKASYSIYVVHQPVLAFMRYWFTANIRNWFLVLVIVITVVLSVASYFFVEKKLSRLLSNKKAWIHLTAFLSAFIVVTACGGIVYLKAGVFRDYPELDVYRANAHRGMHAEYVDIPYRWNNEFEDNGKINILVVGDSMGRDWANVLNESIYSDNYNISYLYYYETISSYESRFKEADYIFFSIIGDSTKISGYLLEWKESDKFYNVGIKNFGECNGQIYQKRYSPDYFDSSISMGYNSFGMLFTEQNRIQKEFYKEKYIDIIDAIEREDGRIPVFTDTKKYISHDTEHLTKNGAKYIAKVIDLSWIK